MVTVAPEYRIEIEATSAPLTRDLPSHVMLGYSARLNTRAKCLPGLS